MAQQARAAEGVKGQGGRALVVAILFAAGGCSTPLPLVDVEIEKIHASVEQYMDAGVLAGRDRERGMENPEADRRQQLGLADLRRVYPHPDGARYVDQEISAAQAFWTVKVEALRKREGELFDRRASLTPAQRDALEVVVRDRDDAERRLAALASLGPAVRGP